MNLAFKKYKIMEANCKLFFLFLVLFGIEIKGQKEIIDFNLISTEINWFIKKAKVESIANGKYNVYLVRFSADTNGFCVAMGYIKDSYNISHSSKYAYYFKQGEELILVDFTSNFKNRFELINNCLKPLVNRKIILDKVYKEDMFLGTCKGYLYCYEDSVINRTFYEDGYELPPNKTLFQKQNHNGQLIQLDGDSLKAYLKRKK